MCCKEPGDAEMYMCLVVIIVFGCEVEVCVDRDPQRLL